MNPWQAEHLISIEDARTLIQTQFPSLAPVDIVHLSEGWDNLAFYVNEQFVFRFPRRQIAINFLENEIALLPDLQDKLPLNIPYPKYIGKPGNNFPWPFVGYEILRGETACRMSLTNNERKANAKKLALTLKTLHEIKLSSLPIELPNDDLRRLDVEFRTSQIEQILQTIKSLNLIDIPPFQRILTESLGLKPQETHTLVHGDLYARHLLTDEHKQLTGIIDWGDMHLNDPAIDLSIAHSFLPASAHDIFRQHYGKIDDETWRLARFRALFFLTSTIVYGHNIGDGALIEESLMGMKFLRGNNGGS